MQERAGPGASGGIVARFLDGAILPKLSILVVLIGFIRIALRPASVQHDVAMYLQAGELLLRGQRPYVDFIDVNPPLITYLSAIPVAVAHALGAPVVPTASFMTASFAALSLLAARRTLVDTFEASGADRLLPDATILALAYAFFLIDAPEAIDLPFPGNAPLDPRLSMFFGQREHLFIIGSTPFLAMRFQRWEGGRCGRLWAVLAGAVASVVTCLKPQFVVVLMAFEVGAWASKRTWSTLWAPEIAAFGAVVAAYAGYFALLPEDVRTAWFGRWLPFIIEGYGVFDEPSLGRLITRCWPAFAALLAAYAVTLVGDPLARRLTRQYALMSVGGALLYIAQRKGWTYHAYPFRTFAVVVAACSVAGARVVGTSGDGGDARFVLRASHASIARALAVILAITGLGCAVCFARIDTRKDVERVRDRSQITRTIEALTDPGDPVLIATTAVWFVYPALTLLKRDPGSRYMWLFPIPMLQVGHASQPDAEADFVSDLTEDILVRRPKLVLIQVGRCFGCGAVTVDGFFRDHASLASALEGYSPHGTVRDGSEFKVFVRGSPPP